METIFLIILVVAVVFGVVGFLNRGDAKDAASSAFMGAIWSTGCMIQLILLAIPVLIGIWLIGLIFG